MENKTAVCFLTVNPSKLFYNFCVDIQNDNPEYDVYITIDNNKYEIPDYDGKVKIIKINDDEINKTSFKCTVYHCQNRACSRDKALYYFCKININYDYIWFIEEDVFIPTTKTLKYLDEKYPNCDLVTEGHVVKTKIIVNEWHWRFVLSQAQLKEPVAHSMICAIRVSKKLMLAIENYADTHTQLYMDEVIFNTLCIQNNLNIKIPQEFKIRFDKIDTSFIDPHCLYHPVKSIEKHYALRNNINAI